MVFEDNLRLSQLELLQQHIYLRSQPRFLGLVLGNACNIYCPHCYQSKNGDSLLKPPAVGRGLRREFMALYPYLATLRIQGGEAFAYTGFRELIEDVAATVQRPLLAVTTNGALIDESWAERMVRLPFRNVTVSIDGGTPATYARLRQGADLGEVLANVRRIQRWKENLASDLPYLDSFFVVMRSNFRELPHYFELMHEYGFLEFALQTVETNRHNTAREPSLVRDEVIAEPDEIRDLYNLVRDLVPRARRRFRAIRTSGLTSLFESQGLETSFLQEASDGLYPDSDDLKPADGSLCPNPWTTLFVAENGDVHLCFLAKPVGNVYETPLASIWNSPAALAKRSHMIAGRYLASGCSERWCSWREGQRATTGAPGMTALRDEMKHLADRAAQMQRLVQIGEPAPEIAAVRRMLTDRDRQIHELQALFAELCEKNAATHENGQRYIDTLEAKIAHLRASERRHIAVRIAERLRGGVRRLLEFGKSCLSGLTATFGTACDPAPFSERFCSRTAPGRAGEPEPIERKAPGI